jgi:pimeloyl-ACP methyl ester carboxylesterase
VLEYPEPVAQRSRLVAGVVVYPGAKAGCRRLMGAVVHRPVHTLPPAFFVQLGVRRVDHRAQGCAVVGVEQPDERFQHRLGSRKRFGAPGRVAPERVPAGADHVAHEIGTRRRGSYGAVCSISHRDNDCRALDLVGQGAQISSVGGHVVGPGAGRPAGSAQVVGDDSMVCDEIVRQSFEQLRVAEELSRHHDERALSPLFPEDLGAVGPSQKRHHLKDIETAVGTLDAMPFFTTDDGLELYYELWGSGDLTILIEAGAFASTETARPFEPLTDEGTTILVYDKRGFGRSGQPDPDADYSVDRLTRDSLALTDALGLERIVALGWLDGAMRAVRRATERPDETAGVVLCGPYVGGMPVVDSLAAAFTGFLETGVEYALPAFMDAGMPDATAELKASAVELLRGSTSSEIAKQVWGAAWRTDDHPLLDRVACPALVLAGTADVVFPPEYARQVAAALPRSRLLELEGAGNVMWLTRNDETLAAIRHFLLSLESAPSAEEARTQK